MSSQRLKRIPCFIALLCGVSLYLDAIQYAHIKNIALSDDHGNSSAVELPVSFPVGRSTISFSLYTLPFASRTYQIVIDDCVDEIVINGEKQRVLPMPLCANKNRSTLDLASLPYGHNAVTVVVRNLGGPSLFNLALAPSVFQRVSCRLLLIISLMMAIAYLLRRMGPIPAVCRVLVSVTVTFFALELLSRVAFSTPSISSRFLDQGSASIRIRWILRNPSRPRLSYAIDAFDPLLGWRLRPSLNGQHPSPPDVTSTSEGTRTVPEPATARRDEAPHIMMFGDSFTFGEEVKDNEAYPSIFATMAPELRVTNCGVHGYGHDQMLLYLKEILTKHRPTLVTLGFLRWDMQRNVMTFRDYAKPRFVLTGGVEPALKLTNVPIPSPERLQHYMLGSRFGFLLSLLNERFDRLWRGANSRHEEIRLTAEILKTFADVVRQHGATPLFIYLPDRGEIDKQIPSSLPLFANICRNSRVACVNPVPRFAAESDRGSLFSPQGHYSGKGNSLVAESLVSFLRSHPDFIRVKPGVPPEK